MEDIVYSSSHGEFQLIRHQEDLLGDLEGSILLGIELCFLIADFEVGCL
jgi:hypothetical protein